MKTVLLEAKCAGIAPPSSTRSNTSNKNWDPNPPARLIWSWSGFLLCGHHVIKFLFVDFELHIVRSLQNVSENCLVAMVSFALGTRLKNLCTSRCIVSCLTRLHPPEGDGLRRQLRGSKASVFWVRQARRLSVQFAEALSFSGCVQGKLCISASRSAILSRDARNNLVPSVKNNTLENHWSKLLLTGSQASQQCISVPRCLFLSARKAAAAIKSLAPRLPAVLRKKS